MKNNYNNYNKITNQTMSDTEYKKLKRKEKRLEKKLKEVKEQLLSTSYVINQNFNQICDNIIEKCYEENEVYFPLMPEFSEYDTTYKKYSEERQEKLKIKRENLFELSKIASIKKCSYSEIYDEKYKHYIEYYDEHKLDILIDVYGYEDSINEFTIKVTCPTVGDIMMKMGGNNSCPNLDEKEVVKKCKKCIIGKMIYSIFNK